MRRITDPAELAKYRRAHAPELAQHIRCKGGDAEAWIWTDKAGRPVAVAFLGRAQNAYEGCAKWFRTSEKRRAWLLRLFELACTTQQNRTERHARKTAARAKPHAFKVGDVLESCWGYDQTNIDYYEVTRLIGLQMIEYRKIAAEIEETGWQSGKCVPNIGEYVSEPKRARVSEYGDRNSIKVSSCAKAYKMQAQTIAGVRVFGVSSWTAYA
jgi:hypothetical protein